MIRPLFGILAIGSSLLSAPPSAPLARVNGVPVRSEGVPFLVRAMKQEGLPVTVSGLGRDLVTLEALRQQAVARGLDQRPAVQARLAFAEQDALAAVGMERIRKEVPAYTGAERDALWAWVKGHALTQYRLHRIEFDTQEEAQRYQGPKAGAPGSDLDWMTPFWARPQDPALAPGEARLLDQMIASGKPCHSNPYRRDGRFRVLVFTSQRRKVDPLLFQPLDPDAEPDAERLQALIPEHHLRRTLARLRTAAKLAPLPDPETPLPLAQRNALESESGPLLAQEARRRGLDREYAEGIAVARAWALAQALFEEDLAERPIAEAELKEACLREGLGPVAYRFERRSFPSLEAAKAARKALKNTSSDTEAPWVSAPALPSATRDALQRLAVGAWTPEPFRGDGNTFLLLRLLEVRPEPGFEAALERNRDILLGQLRHQRWYEMGRKAQQKATIVWN